jgi:lipopolysaccharide export system permease protein
LFEGVGWVSRFDRYLLSQLLGLFGFFSLILVAIYWINQAVGLFEQLIGDGQSGLVFLEFSVLALPNMVNIVLPISAFAAAVFVTNRLTSESELVVMQATGFSAFRLARPVLIFGLIVALMMSLLMHVLIPISRSQLAERSAQIAQTANARFLTAGVFTHPTPKMTLYIKTIDSSGALLELFLSDERDANQHFTYSASRALFIRGDNSPKLLMFDGMVQAYDVGGQRLSITRFADMTFDLGAVLAPQGQAKRVTAELSTLQLFNPTASLLAETGQTKSRLLFEGHNRFGQPLLAAAAAMIGFSALLLGAFSRFGLWRQILFAILLLIIVQAFWTLTSGIGAKSENGWPLAYAAAVLGLVVSALILYVAQNPFLVRLRSKGRST